MQRWLLMLIRQGLVLLYNNYTHTCNKQGYVMKIIYKNIKLRSYKALTMFVIKKNKKYFLMEILVNMFV